MAKSNDKTSDKANDTRSEAEGADGEEGKAAAGKRKLSLKLIIMAFAGLVGLAAIRLAARLFAGRRIAQ
jgi:hypothetical protein